MKQAPIVRRALRLAARLVPVALVCIAGRASASSAQAVSPPGTVARTPELSLEGQAWLRGAIGSGSFPDMRWPGFSDYRGHVKRFYEFNAGSLRDR
jgi:hypothetical protein